MEVVERIVPALVGLTAFGTLTGIFLWQVWLGHLSRSWPSTTGRILISEVRRNPHRLYRVQAYVLYEYRVGGRRYTGTRVTFGGWLHTRQSAADRVVGRYRTGAPVSVRYDPRKPSRSTLERRTSKMVWLFIGIGVFMMTNIFGALMGWWE